MKNLTKIFGALILTVLLSCGGVELSEQQVGVETRQPDLPVFVGKENNKILEITLQVKDSTLAPLTSFEVDLQGTTSISDLEQLEVVYLSQEEDVEPESFGEVTTVSDKVVIEGEKLLEPGTHKFLLQGSLVGTPELTNKIAADISAINFGEEARLGQITNDDNPQRIGLVLREKNEDDINTYRIPGLATTNEGTLIAVYDNRYENSADLQGHVDVGMSRSTDGGQTWEDMEVIMDMGTFGGRPEDQNGIGDPAVLVDRNTNTIWVSALWMSGKPGERNWNASGPGMDPDETGQFILVKSEDDGKTWSEPINITDQIKKPEWRLFFNGPGNGITMEDGTLVFAAQFRDAEGVPHSTIVYSKDGGETWGVGTGAKSQTTEAQVVELEPGTLMLNMRDNRNHPNSHLHDGKHGRSVAITTDFGKTWTEHETSREALPESTCMASIIAEEFPGYGKVLFFSNPNSTTDRAHMTIKASLDLGKTWPEDKQLELYEKGGFGYSCLTKIDDEHIGILYEGARDLYFEKVKIEEVLGE